MVWQTRQFMEFSGESSPTSLGLRGGRRRIGFHSLQCEKAANGIVRRLHAMNIFQKGKL